MMSSKVLTILGLSTVLAAALAGATPAGLVIAALIGAVTISSQASRFESDRRLVYRPVYARRRTVHLRLRSSDD